MMISFSGIDCSGKSTQIGILRSRIEARDQRVIIIWSRGGYTPGIELIKRIISPHRTKDKQKMIQQSKAICASKRKSFILLFVSILDLWFYYGLIMHLQKHFYDVIICDRYIWDTYIDFKLKYPQHSFEEWFIWKMLLKLYAKPDISILLHIPPEISMNRSKLKNDPFPEKIDERRNRLNMYMKAEQERLWQYKIDATSSVEDVSYQISSIIESFVYK